MIFDSLSNAQLYESLDPGIALGLAFLQSFDPESAEERHVLHGDDLFALVQSYDTGPATEKRFESHRNYLDIQYVASGTERILHTPAAPLTVETPYDEEKDIVFYAEPGASSSILVRPGEFAIFWPEDAHKPACMAGGRERVKKVLIKVRI